MMAVSGEPDAVIFSLHWRRRTVMAAVDVFAEVICTIGIAAAMIVLLIVIAGFLVSMYGIWHFDEWHEKW